MSNHPRDDQLADPRRWGHDDGWEWAGDMPAPRHKRPRPFPRCVLWAVAEFVGLALIFGVIR